MLKTYVLTMLMSCVKISYAQYVDSLIQIYLGIGDTLKSFDKCYLKLFLEVDDFDYALFVLNNRKIKLIELYVGNYLATGILIGGLTGSIVGVRVGKTDEPKPPPRDPDEWHFDLGFPKVNKGAVTGCLMGGIIGAIGGGIIGFFYTDNEVVYEYVNPEEYDFKKLNIYARYVNNEPEFLKNIK